jgi:hypothetical protein
MRACFAAGMNQFVAKPVNRETLLTALMRALFDDPLQIDATARSTIFGRFPDQNDFAAVANSSPDS